MNGCVFTREGIVDRLERVKALRLNQVTRKARAGVDGYDLEYHYSTDERDSKDQEMGWPHNVDQKKVLPVWEAVFATVS